MEGNESYGMEWNSLMEQPLFGSAEQVRVQGKKKGAERLATREQAYLGSREFGRYLIP